MQSPWGLHCLLPTSDPQQRRAGHPQTLMNSVVTSGVVGVIHGVWVGSRACECCPGGGGRWGGCWRVNGGPGCQWRAAGLLPVRLCWCHWVAHSRSRVGVGSLTGRVGGFAGVTFSACDWIGSLKVCSRFFFLTKSQARLGTGPNLTVVCPARPRAGAWRGG